jgi:peptide/nickel transport system permease protein
MPGFWLGIMLIIVFAVQLKVLPSSGSGEWQNAVLPVVTLSVGLIPLTMRIVRARMINILGEDYIRAARSRGLTRPSVLYRHALSNAAVAVVSVIGTQFAYLLAGAVAVEIVFAWPGVGSLLVDSVNNSDYPVVQTTVFVIALLTVGANLITDLAVAALDPRIRVGD